MSLFSWSSAIKLLTCQNPPTPQRDHQLVVPPLQTPATGVKLVDPDMHTGLYYAKHFKLTRELKAGLKWEFWNLLGDHWFSTPTALKPPCLPSASFRSLHVDVGLLLELEIKSVAQQEFEFVEAREAHVRDLISALILLLMILITGLLGWVWVGFINKTDKIISL